jgi:hypothetical protein
MRSEMIEGKSIIDIVGVVIQLGDCHLIEMSQKILPLHVKNPLKEPYCGFLHPPIFQPILFVWSYILPKGILVVIFKSRKNRSIVVADRIPYLQQFYFLFFIFSLKNTQD